ncbi:alpha/beta-Hydrolase [Glarea lozoyensis ATCC 20868]|uniref:Alpha/beta-Hydrolase n=1 Tax=Glarea lozoyensis (strain ATCC 20868 / MF5171) TaxID=1116229 RepID=S3DWK2_GLAL2|nr:alpha/beta-Hydrolase [Glarea lozoyensis ATCC 20868]EPE30758.1 alpha/beta-Hydrolase [Glarea lozoyensis ATCC 20868]
MEIFRLINRGVSRRQSAFFLTTRRSAPYPREILPLVSLLARSNVAQRRGFVEIPAVLLPPVVFTGLVFCLWTWKCFMMVIFQNKIIYMPGIPPNARREKISDYKNQCAGIQWREEKIRSLDSTPISLCVASVESNAVDFQRRKDVYILYFQGNASSLPPRLPFLSPVLRLLRTRANASDLNIRYTMVCCSYRGYWTSGGRATEKGIALDAAASLGWIKQFHQSQYKTYNDEVISVVIWGQSIGAGVATSLASKKTLFSDGLNLKQLILETPFLSIRSMLETLYPQKWLPYRYLWPFLRNHLDSETALGLLHARFGTKSPPVLIVEAGKDELVPSSHARILEERCLDLGLVVEKKVVHGALHTEVLVRQEGISSVASAIEEVGRTLNDTSCKNSLKTQD